MPTLDETPGVEKKSHKLWGGRFGAGPTPEFDALNNSIRIDFRLWPHDIRLSRAWAVALWGANVLTLEESQALERGLDAVHARLSAGEQPVGSDEDVHTLIDRLLHDEVGDVASKLHTGRSRNDQVATATR
ncbi:MAG: Argininosuccinate lyase, partial [Gemmatimonadetes bacterium]|nr:Argininosuccinate lyase [Gemmatimonadota bacterium]